MFFYIKTAYSRWTELFEIELFLCIKMVLLLNNLQWLICHKIEPNQTKSNETLQEKHFTM